MQRVLVALDGSDVAMEAAETGLRLLRAQAEITLVTVVRPPVPMVFPTMEVRPMMPADDEAVGTMVKGAEDALETAARRLGIDTAGRRVVLGDAGPALCELAEGGEYDVVVVGSHGAGVMRRVLLGSVSHHVLHHAPCPVLVVRSGVADHAAGAV